MMKKKTKVTWIVVIAIILMIPVGLGGYIYIRNVKMHNEMVKIVKKHENLFTEYMQDKEVDTYHRVKSVTIEYDKLSHNPMGGIMVGGYVNDNKKIGFQLQLDKDNIGGKDRIEVTGGTMDVLLSDLVENK